MPDWKKDPTKKSDIKVTDMQHIPGLFVSESTGKGRGIFCAQDIKVGEVIELCPLILIPHDQIPLVDQTELYNYYFLWPGDDGSICLALGFGSLYNHSPKPNANVVFDLENQSMSIEAIAEIPAFEEILIDYQDGERDAPILWFDPV